MFLKGFGIIFLVIAILLFVMLFFYIREERFISHFRTGLERLLSEAAGCDVTIGDVGGNIFKKIILYDSSCKVGDYTINFDRAQLGYSIWEVVSKRKSIDTINNNLIELVRGSLRFKDNLVISKQIDGRIRLAPGKIVIEGLDFELFSSLNNHIEGEVINQAGVQKMDLQLKAKPFSDRTNLNFAPDFFKSAGFTEVGIDIKGPFNNLNFNGSITRVKDLKILLNGNLISKEGILRFSSRLDFEDLRTGRANTFFADVEIDPKDSNFRAAITPSEGNIIVNGDYSKWPILTADITNNHIKIYDLDFSNIAHLSSKFIFKNGDFSHIGLDVYTESTILNYYPFDEFEISCWADKDLVRLIYLKAGDSISASGVLCFKPPPRFFLKLTLADFEISRLLLISKEEERPIASGKLSGEAVIEGPFNELRSKAKFGARYGHLGTIDYESMLLNMEGAGPVLTIYDSRLIREDSFMTLDGTVDIRKLGKERFLENLKVMTDPNTIIWEGWDISRATDESEVRLSKGLNGKVKVGFTKHMDDETTYQAVKPQDELELEYKMPDEESSLQLKTKEKEEFFGLMKRYKF